MATQNLTIEAIPGGGGESRLTFNGELNLPSPGFGLYLGELNWSTKDSKITVLFHNRNRRHLRFLCVLFGLDATTAVSCFSDNAGRTIELETHHMEEATRRLREDARLARSHGGNDPLLIPDAPGDYC